MKLHDLFILCSPMFESELLSMNSIGFLFRRISWLIPCVFLQVGKGNLSVRGKHEIASCRDVFLSSNYWRLFEHLSDSPKLIVDLGAHCGHFSILCNICILERFGEDKAEYILVEALPSLVRRITRLVDEVGLLAQSTIIQGLVGRKSGRACLHYDSRNLLASRVDVNEPVAGGRLLNYVDLDSVIPEHRQIDILKIDIEGSEYELFENYASIFRRAKIVLIEIHGTMEKRAEIECRFEQAGMRNISPPIIRERESLLLLGHL